MNAQREKTRDKPAGLAGQRLTSQRLLLLNVLREGRHLDADELYERARQKEPRLSMSTIYRNLRLFVRLGLIEKHHFDGRHSYYEAKAKAEHQHLICLGCGRIIDFGYALGQEVTKSIQSRYGFHTTGAQVVLRGYCAGCIAGMGKTP